MASALVKPAPVTAQRPKKPPCAICEDFGVIPLAGHVRGVTLPEILANNMPCACEHGDRWRDHFKLEEGWKQEMFAKL